MWEVSTWSGRDAPTDEPANIYENVRGMRNTLIMLEDNHSWWV